MKKILVVLAILLVPVVAMAGMSAMSKKDMQTIKGQTGITLETGLQVTVGSLAWGDSDGFGTYTTAGWLILSAISLPSVHFGCLIDVGGTASASYLQLTTGTNPLLSGSMTVGNIIIGSTANATTQDLGELRVSNISVVPTYIRISGH